MPFKNLESSDILLSSFEVHKTFTVTNEDTGSGVYAFQINKGADSTKYGWNTTPVTLEIQHSEFGNIGLKTEIYHPDEPKPKIIVEQK